MSNYSSKIFDDIENEFKKMRVTIKKYLDNDWSLSTKKKFLSERIPEDLITLSGLILDTLINYLMNEGREKLETSFPEALGDFYDYNFRTKIREVFSQNGEVKLDIKEIKFSTDPALKNGLVTVGIVMATGSFLTITLTPPMCIPLYIIGELITILISLAAFIIVYKKSAPKSIQKMQEDIENYLGYAEAQISNWARKVIEYFNKEFKKFCINYESKEV